MNKVRSGQEVLEEFILNLKEIKNVDSEIADGIIALFQSGKGLTEKNINNCLLKLREGKNES